MWHTPLSIVSRSKATPRDSSSARAAAMQGTCSASGTLTARNSIPTASHSITATVTVPVSNSSVICGLWPQATASALQERGPTPDLQVQERGRTPILQVGLDLDSTS